MTTPVSLSSQITGAGSPLVILHGLFGSGRNWGGIARKLGDSHLTHALDARNHGESPWTDSMGYEEMAADTALYMESQGLTRCDLLGHSMGGKTAMTLALTRPELVERLIVVDIAPAPYRSVEHRQFAEAMLAADLSHAGHRSDADRQIAPTVEDPTLRAFLLQNLVGDPGQYRWRLNLRTIIEDFPALVGFPSVSGRFDGKVTFISGGRSRYIQPKHEAAMRAYFPNMRIEKIEEAGHWPHAEQPERFLAILRQALS